MIVMKSGEFGKFLMDVYMYFEKLLIRFQGELGVNKKMSIDFFFLSLKKLNLSDGG
jgi:hypothetical protein